MTVYEIPLSPRGQSMTIGLGGVNYRLRFYYANTDMGGWAMDIGDASGNPIACGLPLVTGADLLAQYAYLGIGGAIYVTTDGDPAAAPTFANLGMNSHVLFVDALASRTTTR